MREILFRGKRVDNGEWVMSGNIIRFNDEGNGALYYIPQLNERCICKHNEADNIEGFENAMFYKVIPETVGQYTGLIDKNGKKIFEGDIVKTHYANTNNAEFIEIVIFEGGGFRAKSTYDNGSHSAPLYDGTPHLTIDKSVYMDSVEVIGNIHDNPELLKSEV